MKSHNGLITKYSMIRKKIIEKSSNLNETEFKNLCCEINNNYKNYFYLL